MKRGGGATPDPAQLETFVAGAGTPVQLATGPGGDLFYLDIGGGTLRRIVYTGSNHLPTAAVTATPTSGTAPLTVSFSGAGSTDLDGDPLTYAWDLDGDGAFDDSTAITPQWTYTAGGTVTARLRVTDPSGAADTATATISVGPPNTPPTPVIDTPTTALRWKVGDPIAFSGRGTDAQDGSVPPARLSW